MSKLKSECCPRHGLGQASYIRVAGPWIGSPVLLCRDGMPRARGMAAYVRDGYGAFRQPKFECSCCEMLVFRAQGVWCETELLRVHPVPQP